MSDDSDRNIPVRGSQEGSGEEQLIRAKRAVSTCNVSAGGVFRSLAARHHRSHRGKERHQVRNSTQTESRTPHGGEEREEPADSYELRIINAIRQIIRAVDIDSRKLAADHQVTGPQLLSLIAVVDDAPVTATEIAKKVHVSPSTLVGILDRLEAKGLVERQRASEDRRLVYVTPTEAGRSLVSLTPYPVQYSLGKRLKHLPERERLQLAASVEHLVDLMDARDFDAGPVLEIATVAKVIKRTAR